MGEGGEAKGRRGGEAESKNMKILAVIEPGKTNGPLSGSSAMLDGRKNCGSSDLRR